MKKKNKPLILLFVFFCLLAVDGWYESDQQKTTLIGTAIAGNRQPAEIVGIENSRISIKQNGNITILEVTPDLKIIQQKAVTADSMVLDAPVLIRGQRMADGWVAARVIIWLTPSSFEDMKMAAGRGVEIAQYLGHVVSRSPLKISLLDSKDLDVRTNDRTLLLKEEQISDADLQVGDRVRMLHGKIIKWPDSPRQSAAGKSHLFQLPQAPVEDISHFDPRIAMAKLNSPFGFFDPNMLRFHHLLVYKEFAQTMNDLDANWAAFGATFSFNWNLLQDRAKDDHYKWERVDRLIKLSQNHNIHLIGYIKAVEPDDGLNPENHRVPSLPKSMVHYKKFVSAVVERYDGDGINDMPGLKLPIQYWSIEDEPMSPKYFNGTGADYARLVYDGAGAIKSADPNARVIVSMIRKTGWHKKEVDPRDFMESFFQQLAALTQKTPYDFLDQHWLGEAENVSPSRQYEIYENWLDDLKTTADRYGFKKVPFVNLEMAGAHSSEQRHAADMVKRHVFLLSLGVEKILWSGLKAAPEKDLTPRQISDYFRQVTLIDGEGRRKPAYWSYKLMVDLLDGADWHKTITLRKNDHGHFVFKFTRENHPIWVLWNEDGKSTDTIAIPNDIKQVVIIHAVPDAKAGRDVIGYEDGFHREYRPVENGQISIGVSDIPIFIVTPQEIP